jgi:hypothetical protein
MLCIQNTLDATMNYPGPQYTFSSEHGVHLGHQVPIRYPQHPSQPQHIEGYFTGHPHSEFTDFGHHTTMLDDYEDGVETATRPRLTKDQVDVLESQFQAQAKPNSNVKRQLAIQTKLTLPRVAVSLNLPFTTSGLTVAELVPKPSSKGETTEETRRIRDQKSNGHGRGVEERRQSAVCISSSTPAQYNRDITQFGWKSNADGTIVCHSGEWTKLSTGRRVVFCTPCHCCCPGPTCDRTRARAELHIYASTADAFV